MEVDDDEYGQLLSRRERLRAERQAAHSAPARIRLRLGAVIVIIAALISWLVVSWLGGAASSGEALPEPPPLDSGEDDSGGAAQGDSGRPIERPAEQDGDGGGDAAADSAADGTVPVVVQVAGAVSEPQVVELDPGSRVADAVNAAGGLSEDAALQGVNLAAVIVDGSFIWVPTVEEFAAHDQGPPAAANSGHTSDSDPGADPGGAPVNINTADADQLQVLSGIGPALAERIITYREAHGGFGSLEELAAVSGIGPAIIENIADDVDW